MTEAKYRVGMIGIGRKGGTACEGVPDRSAHADCGRRRYGRGEPRSVLQAVRRARLYRLPGDAEAREHRHRRADSAGRPEPGVVIGCAEASVKGILCEKPFAPSLKEADAMVAACRSNGVKIGAGDLNINLPAYQEAAKMIAEGEIGEVKSIHFFGGGGTEPFRGRDPAVQPHADVCRVRRGGMVHRLGG